MKETADWRAHTLNKPIMIPDCNECKWLNMTEQEQRRDKKALFGHICRGYEKRVLHERDSERLYPCKECEKDDFKGFESRAEIEIVPDVSEVAKQFIWEWQQEAYTEKDTNRISDGFYTNIEKTTGFDTRVGTDYLYRKCRSQCIQNGKACPIYNKCSQRNEIRDILP